MMESPDVNVLVNAARSAASHHTLCREWLDNALSVGRPVGISELVLSAVVRVLTHARVFSPPSSLDDALSFTDSLLAHPAVTRLRPGDEHWRTFRNLCEASHVTGSRVADAYHAALAIENTATWITLDRDFAAFPWLKSRNLLARPGVYERPGVYRAKSVKRRSKGRG